MSDPDAQTPHAPRGLWADSEAWEDAPSSPLADAAAMEILARSGLVEAEWYLTLHEDVAAHGIAALPHFLDYGWREGRRPNPYFDPDFYLRENPDVARDGGNPLLHYITTGEAEGRAPIDCFDLAWYATRHAEAAADRPGGTWLGHFLAHRRTGRVSPLPEFNAAWYLAENPDVAGAGMDPFEHYLHQGYLEGRDPSPDFDTNFYRTRYLDGEPEKNPLLHWRAHRHLLRLQTVRPASETGVFAELRRFTRPGPDFETVQPLPPSAIRRAKLLAFYLPQFHAIPENDRFWGTGFTEWTAIARGIPRFAGHYQPRTPRDLGHYTLGTNANDTSIMHAQIALARGGGIGGFVHYFYWFNGKRVLEAPLEAWLTDKSLDFPFCLMWANENWTRRWDGSEHEVLIAQDYRAADDAKLIDTFARHFTDSRYIRIGGRPLLMVYRAGVIPETRATLTRWRVLFRDRHGENPLLVMAQSFAAEDPRDWGFDAAVEFPPHKLGTGLRRRNGELRIFDPEMTAPVFAYDDIVAASLDAPPPDFTLIKTAVPSWDNDARRQGAGLVLHGATPKSYQAFLSALVDRAGKNPFFGEPIVCVNAWNEWAEGAYLEPDIHYGAAFLNATARAVTRASENSTGKLLLVGHDAFPAGAQHLLLHLLRTLSRSFGVQTEFLLLGDGALAESYRTAAPGTLVADPSAAPDAVHGAIARAAASGVTAALVNTAAAAWIAPLLRDAGMEVTLLIHEMPRLITEKNFLAGAQAGVAAAARIVLPAASVAERFQDIVPFDAERLHIQPQGAYRLPEISPRARARMRSRLGLSGTTAMVLGAGYADLRKGFDHFLAAWRAARRRKADALFCWIGDIDPVLRAYLGEEITAAEATGTFRFPGFQQNVDPWFAAADVFMLASREDPLPTVVLEALAAGLPSVAFDGSGGIPDLIREHDCGAVAPMGDAEALAEAALRLAAPPRATARRARLAALAREKFAFPTYAQALLHTARPDLLGISVVVPSYNYAAYMEQRLASVFAQSYPVREILLLDDASTDDSVARARATAASWSRDITIIENPENSGSAFAAWHHAATIARGDYLWIAEADDAAEPDFLAALAAAMQRAPDVKLAFSDSRAISSTGGEIWPDYKGYYAESDALALHRDGIFAAQDFARRFLTERNLILNVSAVLWRRASLLAALDRCAEDLATYRMAGDWRLHVELLATSPGTVAYVARPLNLHRRHAASVTALADGARHAAEIARVQTVVRKRIGGDAAMKRRQGAYVRAVKKKVGALPQTPPGASPLDPIH